MLHCVLFVYRKQSLTNICSRLFPQISTNHRTTLNITVYLIQRCHVPISTLRCGRSHTDLTTHTLHHPDMQVSGSGSGSRLSITVRWVIHHTAHVVHHAASPAAPAADQHRGHQCHRKGRIGCYHGNLQRCTLHRACPSHHRPQPSTWDVQHKQDNSPITKADIVANTLICNRLKQLSTPMMVTAHRPPHAQHHTSKSSRRKTSKCPMTSARYAARTCPHSHILHQHYTCCWCVDPIDGTKEFVKRTGEFTVNIALIYGAQPVLGVVMVPTTGVLYYAVQGGGAYKREVCERRTPHTTTAPRVRLGWTCSWQCRNST